MCKCRIVLYSLISCHLLEIDSSVLLTKSSLLFSHHICLLLSRSHILSLVGIIKLTTGTWRVCSFLTGGRFESVSQQARGSSSSFYIIASVVLALFSHSLVLSLFLFFSLSLFLSLFISLSLRPWVVFRR